MLALIVVLPSELWETRYELQSLELFDFLSCIFEYESADEMVLDVFFCICKAKLCHCLSLFNIEFCGTSLLGELFDLESATCLLS